MSEQLGKIEKPNAEQFKEGRKLFFVPLAFAPAKPDPEFAARFDRYWEQVAGQLENLEQKLERVSRLYHELVPEGGEDEIDALEDLNAGSYKLVKKKIEQGATFQPVEDPEILAEFTDLSRCLALGLQSTRVFSQIFESYSETQKRRNEHIAKRIDETLGSGAAGLLIMREGHQVQFPPDIQVFYISPPAYDEMKRWVREQQTRAAAPMEEHEAETGEQTV